MAATQIDDVLGCGEPDLLLKVRCFRGKRKGKLEVQEKSFAQVGEEVAQEEDFSATLTREGFKKKVEFLPMSPQSRTEREEPLPLDCTRMRQCKSGALCWVARVSQPDMFQVGMAGIEN